jgi:hypothetical protein
VDQFSRNPIDAKNEEYKKKIGGSEPISFVSMMKLKKKDKKK